MEEKRKDFINLIFRSPIRARKSKLNLLSTIEGPCNFKPEKQKLTNLFSKIKK